MDVVYEVPRPLLGIRTGVAAEAGVQQVPVARRNAKGHERCRHELCGYTGGRGAASCRRAVGNGRGSVGASSGRRRAGADRREVAAGWRRKSAARCRRRHVAAVARRSAGAAAGCRGDVGCGREAAVVYLRVLVVHFVDVHAEVD